MINKIELETLEGEKTELLTRYLGKPILLLFYNNDCLGCTGRALPMAYDFNLQYRDLKVLGIHSNFGKQDFTKEDIINMFTSKRLPFPIFFDKKRIAYKQFNCEGVPHWIILDKKGEVFRSVFGSQEAAHNRLMYALDELLNS
jgi:peroxiredoxin